MAVKFTSIIVRPLTLLVFLALLLGGCLPQPSQDSRPGLIEMGQPVVEDDPDASALFLFGKANLLANDDLGHEALAALQEAVARDPRSEYLRLALAEYALQEEDEDLAIKAAEGALVENPNLLEAHVLLGNLYSGRGDFPRAIEHFRAAVQLSPDQEAHVLALALALAHSGDGGAAIETLKTFLAGHPDATAAELALASLYQEGKLPELAEKTYQKILLRHPELNTARLELGKLYERQPEKLERAVEVFRQLLADNPHNLRLRLHLVTLLVNAGHLEEARAELAAIVAEHPEELEARRKLGLVAMELNRWEEAITVFQQLLERQPEADQTRFYLGTALEGKGDFAAALETFLEIPANSAFSDDALFHRAYLLQKLGRTPEAIALLAERLQRPVERPDPFDFLAALYGSIGQEKKALETIESGLQKFPDNIDLHYQRAILLDKQGNSVGAQEEMKRLLKLDPDHAEALNYLAYSWAEMGENLDQALSYAQKALKRSNQPHIHDTLGWVYFRLGRYEEALGELQKAVDGLPNDPIVLEHLGDACRANHLLDLAAAYYQKALEKGSDSLYLQGKLERVLAELAAKPSTGDKLPGRE